MMNSIVYGVNVDMLISKVKHINRSFVSEDELKDIAKSFCILGFEFDTIKSILSHASKRDKLLDYLYKLKIIYQV